MYNVEMQERLMMLHTDQFEIEVDCAPEAIAQGIRRFSLDVRPALIKAARDYVFSTFSNILERPEDALFATSEFMASVVDELRAAKGQVH